MRRKIRPRLIVSFPAPTPDPSEHIDVRIPPSPTGATITLDYFRAGTSPPDPRPDETRLVGGDGSVFVVRFAPRPVVDLGGLAASP